MSTWFRLGLRNIRRNRRRSLTTIAALAIGMTAVSLFQGYTADTLEGLSQAAIHAEALGHVVVFKRDALTKGLADEEKYTFTGAELAQIRQALEGAPHVTRIAPKLNVSGLVTNGKVSVIFIADAIDPADYEAMRGAFRYVGEGRPLNTADPTAGQMASGLAETLGYKVGETATIFSTTLTGQMNAVDVRIGGIANSGSTATNDKLMRLPLSVARSLYATDGAARVAILLDDRSLVEQARRDVGARLSRAGLDVEVRSWKEMSSFYQSVANLFGTIFLFMFLIVLLVVIMGVFNTMTMAVMERTREIGTLRAMGLRRGGVLALFCAEGLVLGVIGVAIGYGLSLIIAMLVGAAHIQYVPPGNSDAVTLAVTILPVPFALNAIVLVIFSAAAALIPARRAAKLSIVGALGHV